MSKQEDEEDEEDVYTIGDDKLVAAMNFVEDAIGQDASHECAILGTAIAYALSMFEAPEMTEDLLKQLREEKSGYGLKARFALIGYVARNCVKDGYSVVDGFMDPPEGREEPSMIIMPKPPGLMN